MEPAASGPPDTPVANLSCPRLFPASTDSLVVLASDRPPLEVRELDQAQQVVRLKQSSSKLRGQGDGSRVGRSG